MAFNPNQVASIFRRKSIYYPISIGLICCLFLFFQAQYSEYQSGFTDLPSDIKVNSLEYVTWQKNRHRLERDFYLSLCCIISQAFLVAASHWIDKYHRYVEYIERERKTH